MLAFCWERVRRELVRIGDSLPKEERERLPADASENLDHYLYGSPKMRP